MSVKILKHNPTLYILINTSCIVLQDSAGRRRSTWAARSWFMSYWHFSQWHYSTTLPPSSSVWPTWAVSYYYISFTSLPPLFHILNIQSPFFSCILPPSHSGVNEGYFESIKSMSAINTPHWSRKAENLSTAGRTRPKLATGRKLKNIWVGGRAENWEKKKKK